MGGKGSGSGRGGTGGVGIETEKPEPAGLQARSIARLGCFHHASEVAASQSKATEL